MSNGPEKDPTTESPEAFKPAYTPAEAAPKTVEELRAEHVAERTARAADDTEKNNQFIDQLNAERSPRSFMDVITRSNKPYEYLEPVTEQAIAHTDADAEEIDREKSKADVAVEQEAAKIEAEEKKKERDLYKEIADAVKALEEAKGKLYPAQVDMNAVEDIWLHHTLEHGMSAAEKRFKEAEGRYKLIHYEIDDIEAKISALRARVAELKHNQAEAA